MTRRREQEAAKEAKGTGKAVKDGLVRISEQVGADRNKAQLPGKGPKVFETVQERLKRLNDARAMRKLQSTVV